MDEALTHALLAISAALVAATGWRVASVAAPRGLERVVSTAVLAVAAIVLEVLAAGVAGLADLPGVLTALAGAGYLATRLLTPDPLLRVRDELGAWWAGLGTAQRAGIGALVTLLGGWIAWQLQHPYVSDDGELYHLPLAADWAQSGHTARVIDAVEGLPVGNYPITNEVALSWGIGLSRSFVMASIWTPLLASVLVLSGWLGLRTLRVPRPAAALAITGYMALPLAATQLGGPLTDLACASWLIACGALCVAARANPRLLAIAIIAAGLSFGTKTTGSALLALAVGSALWAGRAHLRALARPMSAAVGVGVLVGGLWTLRNTVDHGSPLWPFVSTSFGDPIPEAFKGFDAAFIDHPRAMLEGRRQLYAENLSGGLILLAAALAVPLVVRTRAVLLGAGATLLAVLVWAKAPYTGIAQDTQLAVGAVRYLLPAIAVATLTLALAVRDGGRIVSRAVIAIIGLAAGLSAAKTFDLGFPYVPSSSTVVALLVLGVGASFGLRLIPKAILPALTALIAVGSVAFVSHQASGYADRHTDAGRPDQGVLRTLLADRQFQDGHQPVYAIGITIGLLRGDHLQHRVHLISSPLSCSALIAKLDGPLLIAVNPQTKTARAALACLRATPRFKDQNFVLFTGEIIVIR